MREIDYEEIRNELDRIYREDQFSTPHMVQRCLQTYLNNSKEEDIQARAYHMRYPTLYRHKYNYMDYEYESTINF